MKSLSSLANGGVGSLGSLINAGPALDGELKFGCCVDTDSINCGAANYHAQVLRNLEKIILEPAEFNQKLLLLEDV